MALIINQNFELKSPQFNFTRDYFESVELLNNAPKTSFPNHFITNVAGTLYQLTKTVGTSGEIDETNGTWKKLEFGDKNAITVAPSTDTTNAGSLQQFDAQTNQSKNIETVKINNNLVINKDGISLTKLPKDLGDKNKAKQLFAADGSLFDASGVATDANFESVNNQIGTINSQIGTINTDLTDIKGALTGYTASATVQSAVNSVDEKAEAASIKASDNETAIGEINKKIVNATAYISTENPGNDGFISSKDQAKLNNLSVYAGNAANTGLGLYKISTDSEGRVNVIDMVSETDISIFVSALSTDDIEKVFAETTVTA